MFGAGISDVAKAQAEIARLKASNAALRKRVQKAVDINDIEGRRINFTQSATMTFTSAVNDGNRGPSYMVIPIGQDGPWVMTHYPVIMWRNAASGTATDVGLWRPPSHWPLPDQVVDTDICSLSYEVFDEGSVRGLQNDPQSDFSTARGLKRPSVVAGLFSTANILMQLPEPTLFDTNGAIRIVVTFDDIQFTSVTQGRLRVNLPGYKIVNR